MCYRHDNSWMRRPWVRLVTLNNANISYFINGARVLKPANWTFFLLQISRRWSCGFVSLTQALAVGSGPLCLSDGQNISPLAGPGCCSGSWPLGRARGSCFIDPCASLLSMGTVYFILFFPPLVYYPLVEMEAVRVCACVQNWTLWVWTIPAGLPVHVQEEKQLWLCFSLRLLGCSLAGVGKRRTLLRVLLLRRTFCRKAKQQ